MIVPSPLSVSVKVKGLGAGGAAGGVTLEPVGKGFLGCKYPDPGPIGDLVETGALTVCLVDAGALTV